MAMEHIAAEIETILQLLGQEPSHLALFLLLKI
jgi:hypothetical protein